MNEIESLMQQGEAVEVDDIFTKQKEREKEEINNQLKKAGNMADQEKTTNVYETKVVAKIKESININGTERDKWKLVLDADDQGNNKEIDCWSATLAETVEQGEAYKLKVEEGVNKGGYKYAKLLNVAKEGEEFKERQSQSRYKKNYDAINRQTAVTVAVELIKLEYAPVKDWQDVAEEIKEYIQSGKSS